jgi:glycosyltransferase involved in cell wall biosynthesis
LAKPSELNANVIHVMGAGMMWAGQVLHRKLKAPVTAHISSVDDVHQARHQLRIGGLHLMAISEPLHALSAKKLRLPPERIHLIRPGMRSVAKRGPGTGDRGVFTIFIWAHQKTARNVETVFKALQKLLTAGRQIMAFVIGADRSESRLRKSVGSLGLHARVTFLPEPHLISLGAGGEDVLILPQPPVELHLQTLGALAAGVVIVAAGAGVHDCLRDGETALMYHQEDYGELALLLDRLLQNRPLARRLADQGQAYVRENHQVSAMVQNVVDVYRAAIAEHYGVRTPVAAT